MSDAAVHPEPYLRIRPTRGWIALNLTELWRARDLLLTLAGRDLKLRYRQTALGVAWVLLQPLLAAGVFTLVFGVVAKLPTTFLFSYCGMLAWGIFNNTVSRASVCLVGNAPLVSKIYFPRLVLPLSTVVSSLIDFAVGCAVMVALMLAYHVHLRPAVLLLPLWVLLIVLIALAAGLYAASLTVSYRDVQYLVPVLLQLMLYASPVGYEVPAQPHWARMIFLANPMTGLLQAFRWSLIGGPVEIGAVIYSATVAVVLFFAAAFAFKRMERRFADVI